MTSQNMLARSGSVSRMTARNMILRWDEPRGAKVALRALQREGDASLGGEVHAELAELPIVELELLPENLSERLRGERAGVGMGSIGVWRIDGHAQLVAQELEDVESVVLPGVLVH